jgi:hypothetical protein
MIKAEDDADSTTRANSQTVDRDSKFVPRGILGDVQVKVEKRLKKLIKPVSISDEEKIDWSEVSVSTVSQMIHQGAAVLPKG